MDKMKGMKTKPRDATIAVPWRLEYPEIDGVTKPPIMYTDQEEAKREWRNSPAGTKFFYGNELLEVKQPPEDNLPAQTTQTGENQMAVLGKEPLKSVSIDPQTEEDKSLIKDAADIAKELSKHPDFLTGLDQAIAAREIDDYKSILSLRYMERYLTDNDLAKLPIPGTTKEDVEKLQRPGSNEKLRWDKIKLDGRRTTSFYAEMAKGFPVGQQQNKRLEQIKAAQTNPNDPNLDPKMKEWGASRLESEASRCARALRQITNAVRQAAAIRIQMERIKSMTDIELYWIRDDYTGNDQIPQNVDHTRLEVPGLGDIIKSQKPLSIGSRKVKGKDERYTISQFLAWNITEDVIRVGTIKALKDSVKKEPTGQQKKTVEAAKSRNVGNFKEAMENLEAFVSYVQETGPTRLITNAEGKGPNENIWTLHEIHKLLGFVFTDKKLVNLAVDYQASLDQKKNVA